MGHHSHKISVNSFVGLHQIIYPCVELHFLFRLLFLLDLCLLKHLLYLLLELVPRQEWYNVVRQSAPLVLFFLNDMEQQFVALVSENIEATVCKVTSDLH